MLDLGVTTVPVQTTMDEAAFDQFKANFRGAIIRPGDAAYDQARRVWNAMIDKYPALIARCTGAADVMAAVNFAREQGLLVAVRGGGHNAAGHATNDGGIVIDLSPMKGVWVDPVARTTWVQAGATLADVDRETQVFGLATPLGVISETGVAGLTLGGGYGHMRRKYGLTIDNLLAVDIVTADGQLRRASDLENRDLFWAIRGGGGNFGVVTSFEFRLHPVGPQIMKLSIMYPATNAPEILRAWRDFMATAPDEFASQAWMWTLPAEPFLPEALHNIPVIGVSGLYLGSVAEGERLMQPLRELATPVVDLSGPMTYAFSQSSLDAFFPHGQHYHYWKSINLMELSDAAINTFLAWSMDRPSPRAMVDLWAMGGAYSRVPAEATAYGDRSAQYSLVFNTTWTDPADNEINIAWTRAFHKAMQPYGGGMYVNFPGLPEDRTNSHDAYGANHDRLIEVKTKYDPTNLFRLNQNIQPRSTAAEEN